MTFDSILKLILPIIVLLAFGIIIYSGFKKQKLKDTMEELKEKLQGMNQ